jgi:hypothetical protein
MKWFVESLIEVHGVVAVVFYILMIIATMGAIATVQLGGMLLALVFGMIGMIASTVHMMR